MKGHGLLSLWVLPSAPLGFAFCPFGFYHGPDVTGAPPAVAAQLAISSEGQAFAVFAKSPSALAPLPLYEQLVRPPACLRLTRFLDEFRQDLRARLRLGVLSLPCLVPRRVSERTPARPRCQWKIL